MSSVEDSLEKTDPPTKDHEIDARTTPTVPESEDFPDGGLRAWLVVLGAFCANMSTFGYVNSFGVFQAYYQERILHENSPSSIAWIGSLQYSLCFLPGLLTGRLFDLGYFRIPLILASLLLVVANFLIAQCTKYWHFVLCQGIVVGLACGMIYGPQMAVLGHWFRRKRGRALGFGAIGSSVGGTCFPIAARQLIPKVGFPWTMRILGFILIFTLTIVNLTLRRRLPPKNVKGGLFNPRAFKSAPFCVYTLASFISFLGLYTVLTYIDVSATAVGVSPDFSFYLVAIANASSSVGRIAGGLFADRIGAVNFLTPMTVVGAVTTYSWPFARRQGSLIAVAIVYGFSTGAFVSTFLMPLYDLGEISDMGRRSGMILSITAVGALIGPPISGAINRASGGYEVVGYYAGSMIIVSILLMLLTRHLVLKQLSGKF